MRPNLADPKLSAAMSTEGRLTARQPPLVAARETTLFSNVSTKSRTTDPCLVPALPAALDCLPFLCVHCHAGLITFRLHSPKSIIRRTPQLKLYQHASYMCSGGTFMLPQIQLPENILGRQRCFHKMQTFGQIFRYDLYSAREIKQPPADGPSH